MEPQGLENGEESSAHGMEGLGEAAQSVHGKKEDVAAAMVKNTLREPLDEETKLQDEIRRLEDHQKKLQYDKEKLQEVKINLESGPECLMKRITELESGLECLMKRITALEDAIFDRQGH